MGKPKIVFIPADCIKSNISRSYFLGFYLSNYFDLFWLKWDDGRDYEWTNGAKTSWYKRFLIWVKNIFISDNFFQEASWISVKIPFLSVAFLQYLIGYNLASKLARRFNTKSLTRIIYRVNPDLVFFADSFHFFSPFFDKKCLIFSDLQDDLHFEAFSSSKRKYEISYLKMCFSVADKRYIVSSAAQKSVRRYLPFDFSVLFNGAEFSKITQIEKSEIISFYRDKHCIDSKVVVTYIGGDVWFDDSFFFELASSALLLLPNVIFIVVGNLPKFSLSNVIFVGHVSTEESYVYYNLSDIGILPKDSYNNPFLYNSMPLKIIQYSCLGKPVICPPILWVDEYKFHNVFQLKISVDEWIQAIHFLSFKKIFDSKWNSYDWNLAAQTIWTDYLSVKNV
jgi:hypothetical protein